LRAEYAQVVEPILLAAAARDEANAGTIRKYVRSLRKEVIGDDATLDQTLQTLREIMLRQLLQK
jgi:hypothetical protein